VPLSMDDGLSEVRGNFGIGFGMKFGTSDTRGEVSDARDGQLIPISTVDRMDLVTVPGVCAGRSTMKGWNRETRITYSRLSEQRRTPGARPR